MHAHYVAIWNRAAGTWFQDNVLDIQETVDILSELYVQYTYDQRMLFAHLYHYEYYIERQIAPCVRQHACSADIVVQHIDTVGFIIVYKFVIQQLV